MTDLNTIHLHIQAALLRVKLALTDSNALVGREILEQYEACQPLGPDPHILMECVNALSRALAGLQDADKALDALPQHKEHTL